MIFTSANPRLLQVVSEIEAGVLQDSQVDSLFEKLADYSQGPQPCQRIDKLPLRPALAFEFIVRPDLTVATPSA